MDKKITEFAMASVARRIADGGDKATQMTIKLFAECGETALTPDKCKDTAWNVYKAFAAWFMARENAGVEEDTDDNKAIINAYAKAARTAAKEWFILFGSKPGKKEGDAPRAFVAMDNVEVGIIGDLIGYSRRDANGVEDSEKLKKIFTKYLILETARLLDGKPYVRLSEEDRKAADKAANDNKREKSTQTRESNKDKLDKANDKADKAEADKKKAEEDKAEAEKKLADVVSLVTEAITLVEASHATDVEKAAIIGKLKAAIAQ